MTNKFKHIILTGMVGITVATACFTAMRDTTPKESIIPVAERPKPHITAIIPYHSTMEEVLGEPTEEVAVEIVIPTSTPAPIYTPTPSKTATPTSTPIVVETEVEPEIEMPVVEETEINDEPIITSEPTWRSLGVYKVTAYCPCAKCCGKTNGITASGTQATANRTIAAPSSLPFGTQIKINEVVYTVEDRGGAIGAGRIDVFFNTHQEALNWGVRNYEIFIKE